LVFSSPFSGSHAGLPSVVSRISAGVARPIARGIGAAWIALALLLSAVPVARSQNCIASLVSLSATVNSHTNQAIQQFNPSTIAGVSTSVAANVAANIAAANTAFLTQSTAFVGAPGNPQPDQQGAGIWTRGVVGEVDINSSSTNTFGTRTQQAIGSEPCSTLIHADFDGIQIGADISSLNVNGWNVHLGVTGGSLYTNNSIVGGSPIETVVTSTATAQVPFSSSAQVPFIGVYAAATKGGLFADVVIRGDAYQMNLDSPGLNLYNQNLNATGLVVSGSVGYQYQVPNSRGWFIEPSAGLLYSNVWVDALNVAGAPLTQLNLAIPGTETFTDVVDVIGRLGLRVGTTVSVGNFFVQPFASASVWHDFAGNAGATYATCNGCFFSGKTPYAITDAYSGTNVGTYGQYSLGLSGAIANTGWLGFLRADYRSGPNLYGWDGTGGIRYQFAPDELVRGAMLVKAPASDAPARAPITWDGLYAGAIGGAQEGTTNFRYTGASADSAVAGILGGLEVGYNWQIGELDPNWRNGAWVFGAEGDFAWTDATGGVACGPLSVTANISSPLFAMTCNANQWWMASMAPRIGYAWGRELFYVKGGAAFTSAAVSATCDFGPANGTSTVGHRCAPATPTKFSSTSNGFNASDIMTGWTIGGGVEFALTPNWSAKAEVDYADFGNHALIASDGTPLTVGMHTLQVTIGVNYRLNVGPILAKYFGQPQI
jgi:opacity protein-like surface antigen